MPPKRPLHRLGHPECPHGNWADCDKARAITFLDWQAMQQVILAYNVVRDGRAKVYKKDETSFGQLVQYIAGDRPDILNKDGNPNEAPFVMRLRAAIDRFARGDLPMYNLYEPVAPAGSEG